MEDAMTGPQRAASAAGRAGDQAAQAGQRVENSKSFDVLVTVGLIAYGVVHLLIAWIALQLAWTGSSKEASQKGAFQEMASTAFGDLLVWITAVGLFALALWQIFEAVLGHRNVEQGRKRIVKRLGSAGKAVVYIALGVSAASTAAGASSSGSGKEKSQTARLMSEPFGRVLVIAIGLAVMVVGGRLVYRGIKKKFVKDLAGGASAGVVKLGVVGYIAKGTALAIVGLLFIIAAATFDPQKAGGLDTALRALRGQTFGPILLTVMALGLACFGLYCFAWSRRIKKT
jgi:hypothetical protein